MLLGKRADAFDHPDWLFELKYDGFRALAYIEGGECRLISRNANQFKSFGTLSFQLPHDLRCKSAVIDGEIVCLDGAGKSNFRDLFYRRREPTFAAFDVLAIDGGDCRKLPLSERRRELRRVLRKQPTRSLFCDSMLRRGCDLFRLACECDLEGIVAKWTRGIRNRNYSQWDCREEMFERRATGYPQFRCEPC